jgi:uncharacterized phage-associated protein
MPVVGKQKSRTYTPIAEYFIAVSNETGSLITNLKMQKLVYYADAWHLANFKESLIQEDFQAWVHGPVIPALYSEYKHFGWQPIIREDLNTDALSGIKKGFSSQTISLLDIVSDAYFGLTAYELERLTHNEEPWKRTREGLSDDEPSDRIIDKILIRDYYSSFIKDEPKDK